MHHLDVDQLRTFLTIVRTMNFTQAAHEVAKTQSAVSMQMKRLEETLGKRLFARTGRSIQLTREGKRLIPYARDMTEISRKTIAAFDDKSFDGVVRFGITDDYAERFLPPILTGFALAHPLVHIDVTCGPTYNIKQYYDQGYIDVAFVTHEETNIRSQLVRTEPLLWVSGKNHTTHTQTPVPLAVGMPDCGWRKGAIKALNEKGKEYRIAYSSSSVTVNTTAVQAGLAISVTPLSTLRPDMRVLTEEDGFPALDNNQIGIVRNPQAQTDLCDALIEHILSTLDQTVDHQALINTTHNTITQKTKQKAI